MGWIAKAAYAPRQQKVRRRRRPSSFGKTRRVCVVVIGVVALAAIFGFRAQVGHYAWKLGNSPQFQAQTDAAQDRLQQLAGSFNEWFKEFTSQ